MSEDIPSTENIIHEKEHNKFQEQKSISSASNEGTTRISSPSIDIKETTPITMLPSTTPADEIRNNNLHADMPVDKPEKKSNAIDKSMTETKPVTTLTMTVNNDNTDDIPSSSSSSTTLQSMADEYATVSNNEAVHLMENDRQPEIKGRALNFTGDTILGHTATSTASNSVHHQQHERNNFSEMVNYVTTVSSAMQKEVEDLSDVSMDEDDDDDDIHNGNGNVEDMQKIGMTNEYHEIKQQQQQQQNQEKQNEQQEITLNECINNGSMYKVSEH